MIPYITKYMFFNSDFFKEHSIRPLIPIHCDGLSRMYLFNNYEMDNFVFYGVAGQNLYKSLKIDFILANSTDPNEMPLKLDLHC